MRKIDLKFPFLVQISAQGIAPEGAIEKLRREKIPVYRVKKRGKNGIDFCVERKNRQKVFTILHHSCYNIICIKPFGWTKAAVWLKDKLGVVLGAALFFLLCALSSLPVLRIDVTGSGAYYQAEVLSLLQRNGVEIGRLYASDLAPTLTSQILALKNVTFCSVKKTGNVLNVEVQTAYPSAPLTQKRDLLSPTDGVVERMVVLKGTPVKSVGEQAQKGEPLIVAKDGGLVMASVTVGVAFEKEIAAKDKETAYLQALSDIHNKERAQVEIIRFQTEKRGKDLFLARVDYAVTDTLNMG